MRRPLHPEDVRLWSLVTATVRPHRGRTLTTVAAPSDPAPPVRPGATPAKTRPKVAAPPPPPPSSQASVAARPRAPATLPSPDEIEPRRKRRISMAREPIAGRLDLHGLTQDEARLAVIAFIRREHANGARAVLIITGKGAMGDGVLRHRTPEWLAEPSVRPLIAGLSSAERHHGGEGALYVALKRQHR